MDEDLDLETEGAGDAHTVQAPADCSGQRVDAMLAHALPALSRSRIQGLIGAGKVSVDGTRVAAASDKAKPGAHYLIQLPPPEPAAPLPEALPLRIVFEDEHLIVIDKAAGMAMHPAPGSMTGTLVNALLAHCGSTLSGVGGVARPGIVHRIDKDTTGLVVVAKNDLAHRGLAALFAKRRLDRAYLAITRGAPHPRNGVVETMLARSPDDRRKMAVTRSETAGKHAITRYWTIDSFGHLEGQAARAAAAFLECKLETGRTHQIRAHMAHLGCPLVGDPLYGKQRKLKIADDSAAALTAKDAVENFTRQALHAAVLGFAHPISGENLHFESAIPDDMAALLSTLRALS